MQHTTQETTRKQKAVHIVSAHRMEASCQRPAPGEGNAVVLEDVRHAGLSFKSLAGAVCVAAMPIGLVESGTLRLAGGVPIDLVESGTLRLAGGVPIVLAESEGCGIVAVRTCATGIGNGDAMDIGAAVGVATMGVSMTAEEAELTSPASWFASSEITSLLCSRMSGVVRMPIF
jgi:hypothetical protein